MISFSLAVPKPQYVCIGLGSPGDVV